MAREKTELYSTKDLMQIFSVSRYSITRAIKSGNLTVSKKIGTSNYFSREAIDRYLKMSKKNK